MRLTVLGKSPSWQDVDGACSGYLLQDGETTVLVDCGNGVFGKMRKFVDYVDVDAVVISHLHADHFLDLVPYAYALTYAPRQQPVPVPPWPGTDNPARPRLIAPPGAERGVPHDRRAVRQRAADRERVHARGVHRGLRARRSGDVPLPLPRGARTSPRPSRCARSRTAPASSTAPTRSPNDELVEFADGCDLLLIEATLPRPERTGIRGHLTPMEAGRARARGERQAARDHPHLRRAGPGLGAAPGERGVRRPGRDRARGRGLRDLAARPIDRRMRPDRDLFANFERMRREIDELFGDVFERTGLRGTRLLAVGRRLLRRRSAARRGQGRPRRRRHRRRRRSRSAAASC